MKRLSNQKSNSKGITLIALVITIIVLLILAAVSIATLTGENGILTKANDAKNKNTEGQEKEQIQLAYDAAMADNYEDGKYGAGVTKDQLQTELQKYDGKITVEQDGEDLKVTFPSGNVYTIGKNGKIEEAEKSDITVSLTIKGTPVEEKDIPIPDGFVHVGGSINEGYVISDNSEDENKDVDSDELKGNQFVWVPVNKDQKITAKVESKEEITSIVVTDPYGDDILTLPEESEKIGKTYTNEEIEPTINGEYKIKVTTSKGEVSKTLEVYSLYAQNFWTTDELLLKELEKEAKAEDMTVEEYLAEYGNGMSLEEVFAMMKSQCKTNYKETENYETNVNKNGGFYIGRYEAGDSSAKTDRTESSSKTGELVTKKNKYVYDNISQPDALDKAKKAYDEKINSSLLTGAAWGRTLGWLYETGNKTIEEIAVDSTSWGNYSDDTFSETRGLIKTGECEETKANNIYDLAGNVLEWTTESVYGDGECSGSRGGLWAFEGSKYKASDNVAQLSAYCGYWCRFPCGFIFAERGIVRD